MDKASYLVDTFAITRYFLSIEALIFFEHPPSATKCKTWRCGEKNQVFLYIIYLVMTVFLQF